MKSAFRKKTCGGCAVYSTSPAIPNSETKILNLELTFEEALKLQAAIAEGVQRMNRLDRRKFVPYLTVAAHLKTKSLSVHAFE